MALYSSRLRRSLSLSSPLIHCSRNLHLESSGRISTLLFNPSLSSNLEADARKSIRPFNSHLQCFRFFVSSPVALSTRRQYQGPNDDQEIGPDTILFEGCDYNHWLITIDFPKDEQISAEQMVETYVRTAAKVFGSVEEAKKRIYACSTTTYHGFQVECSEETSQKFAGLPGVVFVLPDSYIDPVNKEYGGDKYIDGTIIPRPPPIQYNNRPSRRNQGYGDGGQMQRGTRNFDRPPRDNYDARQGPPSQPNYGPPQGPPTRQNYGPPPHSSPTHQSYGPPQGPSQQYYGQPQGPPSQQSHGLPQDRPSQQNYGPPQGPPSQQNYGPPHQVPPSQQNYGPPPRVPPSQQNYDPPSRVPLSQQNYGPQPPVPTSQQNYGPPPQGPQSQQRYVPPPPQGPQSQQRYSPPPPQGPPHQQNFGLHSSPPQPNNENPMRQQNYSMQQAPARQNYAHTQDLHHQQNFGRQQNYVPEPQSYGLEQNVPTAASGGWDRLDGGRRDFHHVDNGYTGQRHFEDQTQSSLSTQGGNFNPGLDGTQRQEAGTLYNKSYAREGIDSRFSQSEPRNNIHAGVQVADQVGTGLP